MGYAFRRGICRIYKRFYVLWPVRPAGYFCCCWQIFIPKPQYVRLCFQYTICCPYFLWMGDGHYVVSPIFCCRHITQRVFAYGWNRLLCFPRNHSINISLFLSFATSNFGNFLFKATFARRIINFIL